MIWRERSWDSEVKRASGTGGIWGRHLFQEREWHMFLVGREQGKGVVEGSTESDDKLRVTMSRKWWHTVPGVTAGNLAYLVLSSVIYYLGNLLYSLIYQLKSKTKSGHLGKGISAGKEIQGIPFKIQIRQCDVMQACQLIWCGAWEP